VHESPILPNNFLGVHLRTSIDATAAGWANFTIQSKRYLKLAEEQKVSMIYVASGNNEDVEKFAKLALPRIVVTKRDLLNMTELAELDELSWDQQAEVDWLIIERASFFAGIVQSSFSWNVALGRGKIVGKDVCGDISWNDRMKALQQEDIEVKKLGDTYDDPMGIALQDEWNEILGRYVGAREMEFGIWP
jgi:hypothetical protein